MGKPFPGLKPLSSYDPFRGLKTPAPSEKDCARVASWPPRRFAWLDVLIILSVVVGLCYSIAALPRQSGTTVNVFREGHLIARYPIARDRDVTIDGVIGKLVLRIQNGTARMVEASCPGKICIATGAIRLPSQEIVCVPNRVMITVSSEHSDFDAFTK